MLLRPTHSRIIMPAAITGRDSTARYSAVRSRVARCGARRTSSGSDGDLSSDLDRSLQMTRTAMKRVPVTAVLADSPSMLRQEMKSSTAVPGALISTTASQ